MNESEPSQASFLDRWRLRFGHLPWYRRYEGLLLVVAVWAAGGAWLLPEAGRPDLPVALAVVAWYVAYFLAVATVLVDREKPTWLKRIGSLTVLALFAWLFVRYSGTRWDRVQDQFFAFDRMDGVWAMYLQGLTVTLQLSAVAAAISLVLGLTLGVLRSLHHPVLELFIGLYVDFFRAMPLIVSMVVIFYALPFIGIRLPAFWAATLALVLMNSAYQTEIFRAGIESVTRGQSDAAAALGLSGVQTMWHIVLPQAFRTIIPPLTNNLVSLVKDTAVAYVITVPELLTNAQHAVVWKRTPTPLILSMFLYLATLIPAIHFTRWLERRSARWVAR